MADYKSFKTHESLYDYLDKLQSNDDAIAIIGSGFAALAILQKINSSKNVVVFEKGNHFDPLNLKVLDVNNSSSFELKAGTVEESIGGSSNTWAGLLSEMTQYEFLGSNLKNSFVTSVFKDLQQVFYKQAWKFFYFNHKYVQKVATKGNFEERVLPAQKKPLRVVNALKKISAPIIFDQEVVYVGSNSRGSFLITSFDQKLTKKCYFKKIIVATGGIQSINLINRSIAKGYINSNRSLLPGSGYMNHPRIALNNFILGDVKESTFFFSKYYSEDWITYSLSNDMKMKFRTSNSFFRFQPVYEAENKIEFSVAQNIYTNKRNIFKILLSYFKNIDKFFFISFANIIHYLLFFYRLKPLKVKHYNLQFRLEMDAVPNNFISQQDDIVNTNISLSDNDIKTVRLLFSELLDEIGSSNINKEYTNFDIKNWKKIYDASHHIGGLSINNNKELSYVDENLQLIDSPDIYICSSSIFPRSGSGNPTLTIVALGLRLGDHLNK